MIIDKLKKIIGYITDIRTSRLLLSLKNNGYLKEIGWFYTYWNRDPVDKDRKPIPWATYSFIEFMKTWLKPDMQLFEYGSGNSTLFYAGYVKSVTTVEHNKTWYDRVKKQIPPNVNLIYQPLDNGGKYENSVSGIMYDVIIIDGRQRKNCLKAAIPNLSENGIIVLDDSERDQYAMILDNMKERSFRRIDFWGIAPMYFHNKCTSVFYRSALINYSLLINS